MSGDAVDLLAPDIVQDPYPLYAQLQRDRPVCPLVGGGYLITRHADITAVLASRAFRNAPSRFSVLHASKIERSEAARLANNIVPFQDAPVHTENRKRLAAGFRRASADTTAALPAIAAAQLDRVADRGEIDLVADFGRPYVVSAMCAFMGVDPEREAQEWMAGAEAFFYLFAPIRDAEMFQTMDARLADFRRLTLGVVDAQIREGPPGFVSDMAKTGDTPDDRRAIADAAILLFADGVENVQYVIGGVCALLAEDQALWAAIAEDDGFLRHIVDEALRLQTPAQSVPRIVNEDMTLHDVALRSEMPVFLSVGAGNRDPSVFDEPDSIRRDPNAAGRALTFGAGAHSCIGGRLAAEMIYAAVAAIVNRGVRPTANFRDLRFIPRFGHRWPSAAPARVS